MNKPITKIEATDKNEDEDQGACCCGNRFFYATTTKYVDTLYDVSGNEIMDLACDEAEAPECFTCTNCGRQYSQIGESLEATGDEGSPISHSVNRVIATSECFETTIMVELDQLLSLSGEGALDKFVAKALNVDVDAYTFTHKIVAYNSDTHFWLKLTAIAK